MTLTIDTERPSVPETPSPASSDSPKSASRTIVAWAAVIFVLTAAIVFAVILLGPTDSSPPGPSELTPSHRANAERYLAELKARRDSVPPARLDPEVLAQWRESGMPIGYYPHGFDWNADDPAPPVRSANGSRPY
jgi:hypothetical protein